VGIRRPGGTPRLICEVPPGLAGPDAMGQLSDEVLDAVETRLGFKFRDRSRLEQALTHKSCLPEEADPCACSNERLEFLGDAVLGLVIATHMYNSHPDWPEGELTKAKAVAVSEATLSRVGRELGLGEFLLLGKGEEQSGGRDRPSILADAVEALIAAAFFDEGAGDLTQFGVANLVLRMLEPSLRDLERNEHVKDYKTLLQEASQAAHRVLPTYCVVDESGPDHDKTFVVEVRLRDRIVGVGKGRSKKDAEQKAAREALETRERETADGLNEA